MSWENAIKKQETVGEVLEYLIGQEGGLAELMRKISEHRKTKETDINLSLNLGGSGISKLQANLPFLEHMLDQTTRYSSIDLELDAKGDLEIDAHHTVEDIGITLGAALKNTLFSKPGPEL